MIIAAPSAARLLCNIPLGRLCDKVGRKPLMWTGTGCTAIGTIATGFSTSIESMLPWRLLVGVGSSSSMTGSSAYMQDLSDQAPQHRAKIMGFQQATIGSVWIVGPAIGGFLADWYGYQNSFLIAGVGSALCSFGYTYLPETLRTAKNSSISPSETMAAQYPPVPRPISTSDGKVDSGSNTDTAGPVGALRQYTCLSAFLSGCGFVM